MQIIKNYIKSKNPFLCSEEIFPQNEDKGKGRNNHMKKFLASVLSLLVLADCGTTNTETPAASATVSLKHIEKVYTDSERKKKKAGAGVKAVEDFNLEIADQEFIVLVGPSGCGKSTTLRMVAGLEEISGGDLYIDEKRVNEIAPKDRDIAMVFQNYALYPQKFSTISYRCISHSYLVYQWHD